MTFDNTNPLAYGMPSRGLALYLDSPAFEITAPSAENYETVVRYEDRGLLESGWLVGEENLARKAAVVSARLGQGTVVLIGFPAQHRAQTHGTYKLLFNANRRKRCPLIDLCKTLPHTPSGWLSLSSRFCFAAQRGGANPDGSLRPAQPVSRPFTQDAIYRVFHSGAWLGAISHSRPSRADPVRARRN